MQQEKPCMPRDHERSKVAHHAFEGICGTQDLETAGLSWGAGAEHSTPMLQFETCIWMYMGCLPTLAKMILNMLKKKWPNWPSCNMYVVSYTIHGALGFRSTARGYTNLNMVLRFQIKHPPKQRKIIVIIVHLWKFLNKPTLSGIACVQRMMILLFFPLMPNW